MQVLAHNLASQFTNRQLSLITKGKGKKYRKIVIWLSDKPECI